MINVCHREECRKIYNDKKRMEEIEIKKEIYLCIHTYNDIKENNKIKPKKRKSFLRIKKEAMDIDKNRS